VMIVKWNRKSFCSCLLLLCGDVHLNPGPTVDFPCSICERNVLDGDKAVCCESCDMWVYVSCDSSFSDSVYDAMVENPSEDKWYSSKCTKISFECSQPSNSCSGSVANCLKCLCLNARSILPKRLDLAAYLASLQYDIIAITESFLDDYIANSLVVLCWMSL